MTSDEKRLFLKLAHSRKEFSRFVLKSYAGRGIKGSVVEKYSSQAHFIYELLQNADDAKASYVRFIVKDDELLFFHNGKKHFSISDPSSENEDGISGLVGDINAITAIGGSNKNDSSTIGKFGVGFKAVFQYTNTPHIYDPGFCFKIEDFVVPSLINKDHPGRDRCETLFVFPFNREEKPAAIAQSEILAKLNQLDYPQLFLSHIQSVSFEHCSTITSYKKEILDEQNFDDIKAELIEFSQNRSDLEKPVHSERLWLFTRYLPSELAYCVGFSLDRDDKLIPNEYPAFCYFPTKEATGLKFLIHAPFLLTDSREGILAGQTHNNEMVNLLACLAADSIECLKILGQKSGNLLIDDSVLKIIPYDDEIFEPLGSTRKISFRPFHNAIKGKFQSSQILPTRDGYVDSSDGVWADEADLATLFSNTQLGQFLDNPTAAWVFPSQGRQNTYRYKQTALRTFIDSITSIWISENDFLKGFSYEDGTKHQPLSKEFIENQTIDWLDKFYQWILRSKDRKALIKDLPIFLDQNRNAVSIYNERNEKSLFLPGAFSTGYVTVNQDILALDSAKELLSLNEVKQPELKDHLYLFVLPKYSEADAKIDSANNFKEIFEYYKECPQSQINYLKEKLKDTPFICCRKNSNLSERYRSRPTSIYYPSYDLKLWFESSPDTKFIDLEFYHSLINDNEKELFNHFLYDIGINFTPLILNISYKDFYPHDTNERWPYSTRERAWKEKILDGIENLLLSISSKNDSEAARLLCKILLNIDNLENHFIGRYNYFYRTNYTKQYSSHFNNLLNNTKWLPNKDNEFVAPVDISFDQLNFSLLNISHDSRLSDILDFKNEDSANSKCDEDAQNYVEAYGENLGLSRDEQLQAIEEYARRKKDKLALNYVEENNFQGDIDEIKEQILSRTAKNIELVNKRGYNNSQDRNFAGYDLFAADDNGDSDEFLPRITNLKQR